MNGRELEGQSRGQTWRIPEVQDLQCAWLLCCILEGARQTDPVLLRLVENWTGCSGTQCESSRNLWPGGLGLRSALRLREAAHWASWADTIKMVRARHPEMAEVILQAVEARDEVSSVQAINRSVEFGRDLSHPLGKSWRTRLFTLQPLRTGTQWGR